MRWLVLPLVVPLLLLVAAVIGWRNAPARDMLDECERIYEDELNRAGL